MSYEYSDLTLAKRRALLTQQIETHETQHFTKVMEKISNSRNPNVDESKFDDDLKLIENAIAGLRETRAKLDAERDAAVEQGKSTGETPAPLGEPHIAAAAARGLPVS
jgi:hypothetical protein